MQLLAERNYSGCMFFQKVVKELVFHYEFVNRRVAPYFVCIRDFHGVWKKEQMGPNG
jgi:hypothetical protein